MSNKAVYDDFSDRLAYHWQSHARPEQLMPPDSDPWAVWLYLGGRGAGKTRAGAEAVRSWIETGRCKRVGLIAPTAADARDVMLEGDSGILSICPDSKLPDLRTIEAKVDLAFRPNRHNLQRWGRNRLRGPQHDGLWCDELAAWPDPQHVWDMAMFGLRLGKKPRAIVTTTPRSNVKLIRDLLNRDGSTSELPAVRREPTRRIFAPTFLQNIVSRYQGTRLGRQELDAELSTTSRARFFRETLWSAPAARSHLRSTGSSWRSIHPSATLRVPTSAGSL